MKNKILSIILALTMVLGMIPFAGITVFAIDKCATCTDANGDFVCDVCGYEDRAGAEEAGFKYENEGDNTILTGYTGGGGEIVIPGWTTVIGDWAFFKNNVITKVTIPASVEKIGEGLNVFSSSPNLESVIFEEGSKLKTIGDYAFGYCGSLAEINLEDCKELETIGMCAFEFTGFTSITIPASVNTIGTSAFQEDYEGCGILESVIFEEGSKLKTIGSCAFQFCRSLAEINLDACKELETIGDSAFNTCESLTEIDLDACQKLVTIDSCAFEDTGLTSIHIPASVKEIGDQALCPSESPTDLYLNWAKAEDIVEFDFNGEVGTTTVNIPEGTRSIYIGTCFEPYLPSPVVTLVNATYDGQNTFTYNAYEYGEYSLEPADIDGKKFKEFVLDSDYEGVEITDCTLSIGDEVNADITVTAVYDTLSAVPEVIDPITYDGVEHTPYEGTDAYTVSGDVTGKDVGEYTVTFELKDGYVWDDEDFDGTITWEIIGHTHTHKDSTGADVEFAPIADLTALKDLFANGGSGYLAKDIEAEGDLTVNANVNLCLNDKVLNLNGHHITVNSEKNFALYDCGNTKRYYDKDNDTGLWTLKANGESDYFTTGGVITGGIGINGGGIYNLGTVNMYGGNIAGNTISSDTTTPLGGGVYNRGTFTMYGGNITGNTASSNSKVVFGGGVYNSGTFTMKNGHIDGNTAHSDTGNADGGGVYNSGTFTMKNGHIDGNTAHSDTGNATGGGVYTTQGTFMMEDGSISGNTATSTSDVTGGGVYMGAGTFTMKKGAIDENTAHSTNGSPQGGGVALANKSCVFLMEDGSISNNTSSSDSTSKTVYTGGVDNKGTFTMKNGHIDGNTAYSNYRALGGGLYANGNVGTDNGQTGETIVENGTISNNKAIGATDALGAGVYVATNKTFTMKNGEISGNEAQSTANTANGGGIFSNGIVTMIGGKVTENTANYGGGAYFKGNTFTMKNGEITDNTADFGGGINALAAAKVYLTADAEKTVTIEGNKANIAVGGVNSLGETHLSGKVSVKDNICTNTYGSQNYPVNLAVAAPVSIDGALTGSDIYVTHANSSTDEHDTGVLTSGYATYGADVFTYEGPYEMITNASGELEVVLSHTHTKGTSYMTDGKAHWLTCAGEDCPLKTVEDYLNAFADDSTGAALKEALGYKETVDKGGLMGRQGLVTNNVLSQTQGRTIIGLTQAQLNSIDEKLLVIGCDENGKEIKVEVDCAYTYFYDLQPDGSYQKIEANSFKTKTGEQIIAFVIIDKDQNSEAISGYGYYRLYNGTADTESNFITDVLYVPNKEN